MPRRRASGDQPVAEDPVFTDTLELDLGTVVPALAGPKRPQDRVALRRRRRLRASMAETKSKAGQAGQKRPMGKAGQVPVPGEDTLATAMW
jgi:aconitase A